MTRSQRKWTPELTLIESDFNENYEKIPVLGTTATASMILQGTSYYCAVDDQITINLYDK